MEAHKYFNKSKHHKTVARSRKKSSADLKLPSKISSELESESFVDSVPGYLPDEEYNMRKRSFSFSEYEPSKKRIKLSNSEESNELYETLNKVISIPDNSTEQCKETEGIYQTSTNQNNKICERPLDENLNVIETDCKISGNAITRIVTESTCVHGESEDDEKNAQNLIKKSVTSKKGKKNANKTNKNKSALTSVQLKKLCQKSKRSNISIADENNKSEIMNTSGVQNEQLNGEKKLLRRSTRILKDDNLQVSQENEKSTPTASKKSNKRSSIQNSNRNADITLINNESNLKQRKSDKKQSPKQRASKGKLVKKCNTSKFKKLSKITKEEIKKGPVRKIPKDRLLNALDMIDNDCNPAWEDRNESCNPCINLHWQTRLLSCSDQYIKLKYARQFLLRRDWNNLSKILFVSDLGALYLPLLSKYATLLMAHTDKEKFDQIIQYLTSLKDTSSVIKKCTKISNEAEE